MAITRWKTAGEIINLAAPELGIPVTGDPLASADQNVVLLSALLNSTGQYLTRRLRPISEATLTIAADDTGFYSLPDDFVGMVDQSGWDRTRIRPLSGPLSSQEWQAVKARNVSGTQYARFRIVADQMELATPLPAVGTVLALEYITRAWVQSVGATSRDKDAATLSTDTVLYDPLLMTRALKYHWRAERGFDSTKALSEYEDMLAMALSDGPAAVLDLNGRAGTERFLGFDNLPDTGYGT